MKMVKQVTATLILMAVVVGVCMAQAKIFVAACRFDDYKSAPTTETQAKWCAEIHNNVEHGGKPYAQIFTYPPYPW